MATPNPLSTPADAAVRKMWEVVPERYAMPDAVPHAHAPRHTGRVPMAGMRGYAQARTVSPQLTPLADLEKGQKITPPGMDCTRTGLVTMSTNVMMACRLTSRSSTA